MKRFSLEEYLKNPSRKVVTRDGGNVRIVCTDVKSKIYPILALVDNGNGEVPTRYTKYGKFISKDESLYDLFFATEKHEGWLNIYRSESGFYLRGNPYKSKKEAKKVAKANYKTFCAIVKIEWEE